MFLKKSSTIFLSSLLFVTMAQPVAAGQPQFPNKVISINARGQKVSDVITDVFNQSGLKVKVSSAVTGQAQAMFVGSPAEIWGTISRAFNVVAYYDGSVVRVYAAAEISTRTIQADSPGELVREAGRLNLTDNVNKVRAGNGAVVASGVPEFLSRIDRLASQMPRQAAPPPREAPAIVATPAPSVPAVGAMQMGTVASPLLSGADIYRGSSSPVPWEVRSAATPARRYETRVYRLRFRDAADKDIVMQGRTQRVPGVATLLMEHIGFDSGVETNRSGGMRRDDDRYSRRDPRGYGRDDDYYEERSEGVRREPMGRSILADSANNSIIIRDLPGEMNNYTALISEMDREQPVVDIEVVSVIYNRDDMTDLGVDWSLGIGGLKVLFGGKRGGGNIGGSYLWGNGDVINAQITALQEQGMMRVTDRQFLSATNNEPSEYVEGGTVNAKLQAEYNTDLRSLNYGLSINIKPAIVDEPNRLRVRMDINFRDTTITNQSVDGIPGTKGQTITQNNIVPHGEAIILAGRTVNFEYDKKSKTPLIGDIPFFGNLFKKRNKGMGTMERVVMIIPRVRGANQMVAPGQAQQIPLQVAPPQQVQPQVVPVSRKGSKKRRNG